VGGLSYRSARPAAAQLDLAAVAKYMFWLMYRNVASDGMVFDDPVNPGIVSAPGCVLASPSWENSATHVTQDYVYHWTRDAAIVALELAWAYANGTLPDNQALIDYVRFSQTCQQSAGDFDRGSYYINGTQRPWTNQADGPALQTLALLAMYRQLDPPAQATATESAYTAAFDGWRTANDPQTGILVVRRGGKTVFVAGHNTDGNGPSFIGSMSKAITGACVATLIRDGSSRLRHRCARPWPISSSAMAARSTDGSRTSPLSSC